VYEIRYSFCVYVVESAAFITRTLFFFRCDNFCDKNRRLKFADVLLHEVTVTTALWLVTVDQLFFVSSSLTVTLISVYILECDLIVLRFD